MGKKNSVDLVHYENTGFDGSDIPKADISPAPEKQAPERMKILGPNGLFQYASRQEKIWMILGTIAAIIQAILNRTEK